MGDLHVDERNSPPVVSPEEMAGRFHGELIGAMPDWKRRLGEDPSRLAELEHDVHEAFSRGADLVVAGLIALVMKQAGFEEACEQTRQNYRFPLSRGRTRSLRIRLFGGLLVWVTSLYCEPRRGWFRKREEKVPGLHVELAQFGFGKGCSPALESRVSRQAALCPSLAVRPRGTGPRRAGDGRQDDCPDHLPMRQRNVGPADRRTDAMAGGQTAGRQGVRGQTHQRGDRWRTERKFAGICVRRRQKRKRRTKTGLPVENAPGRSKKRPRQTFDAEWREPKLVTIFVHDEHGRMEKQSRAVVDGTFLGPDAIAELVAMHLHRLGAARAASITFGADGAHGSGTESRRSCGWPNWTGYRSTKSWTAAMPPTTSPWLWRRWG